MERWDMKVRSTVVIGATPEAVWRIITDAGEYPKLERRVEAVRGRIAGGEELVVIPSSPGYRNLRYAAQVTVAEFSPCGRMVWEGRRWLGLLRGSRTFELVARGDDGKATEFTVTEEYTGLTEWLLGVTGGGGLRGEVMEGLDELTAGVKRRVGAEEAA